MAAATRQLLSVTSELYDRGDLVFAESKRLTKLDAKVASAASSLSDALRHAQPSESTLSSRLSSSGVLEKALSDCEAELLFDRSLNEWLYHFLSASFPTRQGCA
jgi:hypothetical protein